MIGAPLPPHILALLLFALATGACAVFDPVTTNPPPPTPNPNDPIAIHISAAEYLCDGPAKGTGTCHRSTDRNYLSIPPTVPIPQSFTEVAAGKTDTCAVTVDGAIVCWGRTHTPPVGEFRSVALGCAVAVDGAVVCWHPPYRSRLGAVEPPEGEFVAISGGQVNHGRFHYCALAPDGSVSCWGYDFANPPVPPWPVPTDQRSWEPRVRDQARPFHRLLDLRLGRIRR